MTIDIIKDNPKATVTENEQDFLREGNLPKAIKQAIKPENTLKFSISKSQKEANIQIVFDKNLTEEQIKEIQKITNGNVNKFFNNKEINNILEDAGITVDEVIVTKFVGKKVSLFPKHAGKVTFKDCTFKDDSQIYIQGNNNVTFDGCTFGDGVSIHSINENANVTIINSKLPKKIESSANQAQRILDRERSLKFFGTFRGLTLQNNYDEIVDKQKRLGGLIDAANAEIKDGGRKMPIIFKDKNNQQINPKDILKLYGGSLIKKSNLGQELYDAQIEAKRNDLIKTNPANTSANDEEIEKHCVISKEEKILRSVSLVDDTFEYEKSLKKEALPSEEEDKKRALESLKETRESVAKSAYNEITKDNEKLMADYKATLPKIKAQAIDEMQNKDKEKFCKKHQGKLSHERAVRRFFKEQFEKLKGQVNSSNNSATASGTPTSKPTGTPTPANSNQNTDAASGTTTPDPASNTPDPANSNQNTDAASGKQNTDSDTQTPAPTQTPDPNTNKAQNADTTANSTRTSNPTDAQSTNAANDTQVVNSADNDVVELDSDEEESDTPSNNENITDKKSTATEEEEEEEFKAQKNSGKILGAVLGFLGRTFRRALGDFVTAHTNDTSSDDVSAGTSDKVNEQIGENNNQEPTSSSLMNSARRLNRNFKNALKKR